MPVKVKTIFDSQGPNYASPARTHVVYLNCNAETMSISTQARGRNLASPHQGLYVFQVQHRNSDDLGSGATYAGLNRAPARLFN
ncbi:hypothetical protein R3P38DRAFT_3207227 [Favolaschia claudopus]|uniref:Uncharacterized protein n=1 Tax=Favolaschia claudopus TaxID=2862362 RepID=A0AAW0AK83_9AGAR